MKTIKTESNNEIKIYSSSREMSIGRYAEFQKYLIKDVGLSETLSFLERAKAFNEEEMYEESLTEIKNSIVTIANVDKGVGIGTLSFACIVSEINGVKITDYTEDGLNSTIKELDNCGLTYGDVESAIEDVKKKSN